MMACEPGPPSAGQSPEVSPEASPEVSPEVSPKPSGEFPSRFRYVLWSHASHDIPCGPRRRPGSAAARAAAATEPDPTADVVAVTVSAACEGSR